MTDEVKKQLADGLEALHLTPDQTALDKLALYCDRLLEKNQVMNLTAITEPGEVVRLHFLDSAALLPSKALHGKKIIDVGTGAGFPGLVLKILDPSIQVTLFDTLGKRIRWLEELCGELELTGVTCVKGRAEEYGRKPEFRDTYDAAVSRAVASMPVLSELCMPFVKAGGLFMAMKSNKTDEEIESAEGIIRALGGKLPFVMDYKLPGDEEVFRRIVTVYKQAPTPAGYPRRWSKIKESNNETSGRCE